jgi:hypothetical protein
MDAPSISIKIRGLQALEALNGNGQLMGGIKIKGTQALMGLREIEGNRRAVMANKGMMMREIEMEGRRQMMMQPTQGATAAKGAVTKGTTATVSTVKGVAAKTAVVSGASAGAGGAAALNGVGWGLGLGGLGPWLALAALGLAATGVYFYLRAQQLAKASAEDMGDLD